LRGTTAHSATDTPVCWLTVRLPAGPPLHPLHYQAIPRIRSILLRAAGRADVGMVWEKRRDSAASSRLDARVRRSGVDRRSRDVVMSRGRRSHERRAVPRGTRAGGRRTHGAGRGSANRRSRRSRRRAAKSSGSR